jgi:hypothetical protein
MKLGCDGEYDVLETVETRRRRLPGTKAELQTEASIFVNACEFGYEAGTTGDCGGDSGHGGRTYLRLEDVCSTDFKIRVDGGPVVDCNKLEIYLGGDAELAAIKAALAFVLSVLEVQSKLKA